MNRAPGRVTRIAQEAVDREGALIQLGIEPYDRAHDLQLRLVDLRLEGAMPDTLLLLEHEPVITLGRRGESGHILADEATLSREHIQVRRVERGGDVTYHGPGQLVGYPIVLLAGLGLGISDYMHALEEVMVRVCADFGLGAQRRDGLIGVWVGQNKIAAMGVRVRHGVAFHGFALNVSPRMAHWQLIIPCGITDGGVTSIAEELGAEPSMQVARECVAARFAGVFGLRLREQQVPRSVTDHLRDPR